MSVDACGDRNPEEPVASVRGADRVCPASMAWMFDNPLRRWLTGSRRMAKRYLREGMVVLDVGCGPAPMLLDIARVVGRAGRIICADIQEKMLAHVQRKAERAGILEQVQLHRCEPNCLGLPAETADFAIAFWMVHEAPDPDPLLAQIVDSLRPGGQFLVIEPRMHVRKRDFEHALELACSRNLVEIERPRIRISRAALLQKPGA